MKKSVRQGIRFKCDVHSKSSYLVRCVNPDWLWLYGRMFLSACNETLPSLSIKACWLILAEEVYTCFQVYMKVFNNTIWLIGLAGLSAKVKVNVKKLAVTKTYYAVTSCWLCLNQKAETDDSWLKREHVLWLRENLYVFTPAGGSICTELVLHTYRPQRKIIHIVSKY